MGEQGIAFYYKTEEDQVDRRKRLYYGSKQSELFWRNSAVGLVDSKDFVKGNQVLKIVLGNTSKGRRTHF